MNQFRTPRSGGLLRRCLLATFLAAATAGCSTLPASGPTGQQILNPSSKAQQSLPFTIVELDTPAALPAAPGIPVSTLTAPVTVPTDLVGPGDVLNVSVYEAGVSLFGGSARIGSTGSSGASQFDATAKAERIQVRVDDAGYISLPYAGRIRAEGQTARELALLIRLGLRGLSQDPQVLVTFENSLTSSIILAGEVTRPGRLVLNTNRETLSDTIALAGGFRGEAKDLVARVQRAGESYEIGLADVLASPALDLQIAPGDRITLISRPQSFSVLGAANKSEEIRFPKSRVSLAQAVALSGGANPNAGDAAAIFVFRYMPQPNGTETPLIYHLNMMRPGAYFLSQRFAMRDGDVLYVGNARANQPSKLIQLLSQLFAPIVTVRNVAAGL
ncbi:MAG TPA: polysaccharide biosynthesis/export family protein [Tepidisphaeraceae bacterium]